MRRVAVLDRVRGRDVRGVGASVARDSDAVAGDGMSRHSCAGSPTGEIEELCFELAERAAKIAAVPTASVYVPGPGGSDLVGVYRYGEDNARLDQFHAGIVGRHQMATPLGCALRAGHFVIISRSDDVLRTPGQGEILRCVGLETCGFVASSVTQRWCLTLAVGAHAERSFDRNCIVALAGLVEVAADRIFVLGFDGIDAVSARLNE